MGRLTVEIEVQYNRIRDMHAVQAINQNATVPVLLDSDKEFKTEKEQPELGQNAGRAGEIETSFARIQSATQGIISAVSTFEQLLSQAYAEHKTIATIRANIKKNMLNIEKLFKE